jgi:hypothetical protein
MSAVRSLSVEKRTYRGQGENDGVDPMQTFSKEPASTNFCEMKVAADKSSL